MARMGFSEKRLMRGVVRRQDTDVGARGGKEAVRGRGHIAGSVGVGEEVGRQMLWVAGM